MLVCEGRVYISCTNYAFSNNDCYCCWFEAEYFKWGWGFDYTIVKRYFPAHPSKGHIHCIHQLTAWSVPHARAQPYHPGSGSHGQLFRPYWAHQYGIAVIVLSLSRIKMSKIQVNRQWRQSACSLRGRPLKGKGKDGSAKGAQGKGKGNSPPHGQAYPQKFY